MGWRDSLRACSLMRRKILWVSDAWTTNGFSCVLSPFLASFASLTSSLLLTRFNDTMFGNDYRSYDFKPTSLQHLPPPHPPLLLLRPPRSHRLDPRPRRHRRARNLRPLLSPLRHFSSHRYHPYRRRQVPSRQMGAQDRNKGQLPRCRSVPRLPFLHHVPRRRSGPRVRTDREALPRAQRTGRGCQDERGRAVNVRYGGGFVRETV